MAMCLCISGAPELLGCHAGDGGASSHPCGHDACAAAISVQLSQWRSDGDIEGGMLRVVVTYEPGCAAGVPSVVQMLRERHGEWVEFTCARLRVC